MFNGKLPSLLLLLVVVVWFGDASGEEISFTDIFGKVNRFLNKLQQDDSTIKETAILNDLSMQRMRRYEAELNRTMVWLTVASDVNATDHEENSNASLIVRSLEIHWRRPAMPMVGDYLAIHRVNDSKQIIRFMMVNPNNNITLPKYYRTRIEFDSFNMTKIMESGVVGSSSSPKTFDQYSTEGCLGYFLVYVSGAEKKVEAFNCIKIQSQWMRQNFDWLQHQVLSQIMIPGTHDTSSYMKYSYDQYEQNLLNRFQFTQDETIYNQLAYGIRYLDFRVGIYNSSRTLLKSVLSQSPSLIPDSEIYEEFWMVHDINRNPLTLLQALKQVKLFIEHTSHEIVIVDFHRFVNGFDGERDLMAIRRRLTRFVQLVNDELGSFLIPYQQTGLPSIGQLIKQNKRILIGYSYKFDLRSMPDSLLFWPAVQHLWANTDELSRLESYIEQNICRPGTSFNNGHRLRSVMAELTPTIEGILLQRYHGLREIASMVNMNFDQWFRNRWWKCSNIVSADFFLGSDIVHIAIDVNQKRFKPTR